MPHETKKKPLNQQPNNRIEQKEAAMKKTLITIILILGTGSACFAQMTRPVAVKSNAPAPAVSLKPKAPTPAAAVPAVSAPAAARDILGVVKSVSTTDPAKVKVLIADATGKEIVLALTPNMAILDAAGTPVKADKLTAGTTIAVKFISANGVNDAKIVKIVK